MRGVPPDVFIHPQHRDAAEPVLVLDQAAPAFGEDGGVGGVPGDREDPRNPVDAQVIQDRGASRPVQGGAGELDPRWRHGPGVFLPEPSASGARVPADAQQQGGGLVPVGDVSQAATDRAPGCAHRTTGGVPGVRCWPVAVKTELVEVGGRGEIGCGEGGVGHVEVFRDGYCWAASIMGGLDVCLGMRRAGLGWGSGGYTLNCEEPGSD